MEPSILHTGSATDVSQRLRDRRREKSILSCTFCRARKVRCDRQMPCNTCTNKGIGHSCRYTPGPQRQNKVSVGDRIEQLESLVRSLAQQPHNSRVSAVRPDVGATDVPTSLNQGTPKESPSIVPEGPGMVTPMTSTDSHTISSPMDGPLAYEKDHDQPFVHSPASSEYGSMRHHSHGANYVGSIHWSAVLDSISELKDHYEKEEEARMLANNDPAPYRIPGPLLLYQPVHTTKAEILASIPPRSVTDRIVARYFNLQNSAPIPVIHSGHFLKQYENFWQDPASASLLWLGLLFSMMALSTQHQQLIDDTPDTEALARISVFRERIVHCLVLGEFIKGKEYVLETLIHYATLELLLCKDADIGAWLLMGLILQLALSRGYHRDPQNFPKISPFDAEMRRRVWAVIVQMDLRISSQMGFPRLLKLHQCDTIEPLNLIDSDFDETTMEMPPSRSESDNTPVLYLIARNRIDHISGQVSDLLANTQEHSYTEVMRLDDKLQGANKLLPPSFQWQPLSQSLTVPPQIVMQRIWLQLSVPRMTIWLHRKYLGSAYDNGEYEYSRKACIQAAIQIVEFQKLLDDETQSDGMLYPVRWMLTSLSRFVFLLGMSVLCYYLQLSKKGPDGLSDNEMAIKIYDLLRSTYPIWLRWSPGSREAQKAAEHLSLILGLGPKNDLDGSLQHHEQNSGNSALVSQFGLYADSTMSFDPFTWNDYQEQIMGFPSLGEFDSQMSAQSLPQVDPTMNLYMADLTADHLHNVDELMQ